MYTFESKRALEKFISENVINTTEALKILECKRQNLHYLIENDIITPIKEMPRDRLFWKEDIEERKMDRSGSLMKRRPIDLDTAVKNIRSQNNTLSPFLSRTNKLARSARPRSPEERVALNRACYYTVRKATNDGYIIKTEKGYNMSWISKN